MANSFEQQLITQVDEIAKNHGLKPNVAFSVWFGVNILQLSETDAISAVSCEGANDKGVDLFWVDDDDEKILIMQFKFSKGLKTAGKETDFSRLQSSLNWLSNPKSLEKDGKLDLAESAKEYEEARKLSYAIELWYVHTGPRSKNVEKDIRVFNQNPDNIERDISAHYYYFILIENTYTELTGAISYIPQDEITLKNDNVITASGKFGDAIVAILPGEELVRLYHKYGDKLFDGNVRLSLGHRKGSVNAGILETLRNNKERDNFWAYNNGISFICDKATHKSGKLSISNFSIINGCQTTVLLSRSDEDLSRVDVLARFISPPQEIVDNVILYNNSQNPIKPWDIASRHRTQRRLVKDFSNLEKPVEYFTRRGPKPKAKNGEMKLILPFEVVGQYVAAFGGNPVLAWKHKGFVFKGEHDNVFRHDVRAEEILFQYTCGEICKEIVSQRAKSDEKAAKILRRGGPLFVLAATAYLLELRNGTTYLTDIGEERAYSLSIQKKVRKYAEFALQVYIMFVKEVTFGKEEMSAVLKRREIFDEIKKKVKSWYDMQALAPNWLNEALPKI